MVEDTQTDQEAAILSIKEATEILRAPPEWRAFLNNLINYNREKIIQMTDQDEFVIERTGGLPPVTITRSMIRKIGVKEWNAIRKKQALLETLPDGFGAKMRAAELNAEIYLDYAKAFLDITDPEEFYRFAYSDIKDLIDLLAWETLNGRPLSSRTSKSSTTPAASK